MTSPRSGQPRVALIVDHPERDLAGLVLVAHALCQRGVVCDFVPLNLQEPEVWALRPDLVLLNFLRRGTEAFGRRLLTAGIPFGLLDTEGGVFASPERYAELLWTDAELRRAARPLCLWGPRMGAYLAERGLVDPRQVSICGCPRFDFYAAAWAPVLNSARPSRDDGAPRILVNTNFSLINGRFASREQNFAQARGEHGWSGERIAAIAAAETQAIAKVIELVRGLARDYAGCRIVLRPHPFERPEPYQQGLSGLSNVEVGPTGPIQPQIVGAAAVIQRSCTTAIEAGLASVPALSPQWIPAPILVPMAEAVSVACASYAELRGVLQGVLEGRHRPEATIRDALVAVIRDWFCSADGLAHERVASAVWQRLQQRAPRDDRVCRRFLYGRTGEARPLHDRVGRCLRHRLKLSPDFSFRRLRRVRAETWGGSDKRFEAQDVQRIVDRIVAAKAASGALGGGGTLRAWQADRPGYRGFAVTLAAQGPSADDSGRRSQDAGDSVSGCRPTS